MQSAMQSMPIINANAISYTIIDVTAISFLIHATVISSASNAKLMCSKSCYAITTSEMSRQSMQMQSATQPIPMRSVGQ